MLRPFTFMFLAFSSLLFNGCEKHNEPAAATTPEQTRKLNEIFTEASGYTNLKSLVVSYRDSIIREGYYNGGGADSLHDVRSVTKSVTALLYGIALEKGTLACVDSPIARYIPSSVAAVPADKRGITIRHLLTMSGGFQGNELTSLTEYSSWATSANQTQYILQTPLSDHPGARFNYNSQAFHLLSVILTTASGKPTLTYARQYLFAEAGIATLAWETDNQGYNNGGAGIQVTPRNMIAVGRLVLHRGMYGGTQLVPAAWIDTMTRFQITTNNAVPYGPSYGFGWWMGDYNGIHYAFAHGWGGQFIVVVPDRRLVVVATNAWRGVGSTSAQIQWYQTLNLIVTRILPIFDPVTS